MPLRDLLPWTRRPAEEITEAKTPAKGPDPAGGKQPERAGYLFGVPEGGLDDVQAGMGASTGTDRKSMLQELYEAYLACPWSWSCVNAIARTITAGGLVTDWDADDDEGDQKAPGKPPEVLALEAFLAYCNPTQDIRQVMRNAVADLEVFGGAYLEIAWWGSLPVAIWNQDYPTTTPLADVHGSVTGYVQVSDYGQRVQFEPRQIIYISLDSARSGVFGVSPTQAMMGPITAWLFAASTGKEMFRKGLPPVIHADLPQSMPENDAKRWGQQYVSGNLGAKNIGRPITTRGGGKITQMQSGKVADVLAFLDQKRDEVIAGYGVPPAKAGVIESGNLGGGTGEDQDRALDLNTMIPTPSGWTTMGELKIGDQVFDEAGHPCNVIGTYEVPAADSWRVVFSDGTHIDACSDHLWVTWTESDRKAYGRNLSTADPNALPENWPAWRTRRGTGPRIRQTAEIQATLIARKSGKSTFYNHSIPVTGALDLRDASLPIDPYTLGAWLGDGTSANGSITVGLGSEQILDEMRKAGFEVTEHASTRNSGRSPGYTPRGLYGKLRRYGLLGDKHVPEQYLRASAAQRLALLQGLMDTDGGFSSGQQVLFRNTNERLIDAVVELARSLGQKPVKSKGIPTRPFGSSETPDGWEDTHAPIFGVTWTPTIQVFRLRRKAMLWRPNIIKNGMRLSHRMIIGAEKIPDRDMRCIRVDSPNAMYLAGEGMIPTHNTYRVDTCGPIAELILEKINFHIVRQGFHVTDWHLKFGEVDYRSSMTIEQIRDMRLRNGTYTRNRYAAEIGEPPCDGGDDPVLVDRQNLVLWADMQAMSKAVIANKAGPPALPAAPDGQDDPDAEAGQDDKEPPPPDGSPAAPPGKQPPGRQPPGKAKGQKDEPPPKESWQRRYASYRKRMTEALEILPGGGDDDDD